MNRIGRSTGLIVLWFIVIGVAGLLINRAFLHWPEWCVVLSVFAIAMLVCVPLIRNQFRQANELQRADCLMCPTCGYSLVGLSSAGQCPECGEAYTHAELRRLWLDAIDGEVGSARLEAPDKRFGRDLK